MTVELPAWLEELIADPQWEALLRVLVAGVLAVLVGIEREREGKPAGARTYGLVAMGAAIFTVVGIYGMGIGDPASRVAAQIVTGIGFIGAGAILQMRERVIGLTTAAGMWVAAGIGMAVGSGLYVIGIGSAIALFALLQLVRPGFLRPAPATEVQRNDQESADS